MCAADLGGNQRRHRDCAGKMRQGGRQHRDVRGLLHRGQHRVPVPGRSQRQHRSVRGGHEGGQRRIRAARKQGAAPDPRRKRGADGGVARPASACSSSAPPRSRPTRSRGCTMSCRTPGPTPRRCCGSAGSAASSIHTSMRVEKLLRNADGEIIGARANGTDFFGRRGVILATGDYSASTEMKAKYVGGGRGHDPAGQPQQHRRRFQAGNRRGRGHDADGPPV